MVCLADEEMTKILDSVIYHSKSIVDITRENNIPHTTCHRKEENNIPHRIPVQEFVLGPEYARTVGRQEGLQ